MDNEHLHLTEFDSVYAREIQGNSDPSPYTVEILLEALRAVCHTYCGVVPGATASHGLPPALLEELAPPTHAQATAGAAARLERCIGVALSSIGSLALVRRRQSPNDAVI